MIIGNFHQGSGLGNQLHRYVATRVKAADLGVDWAMMYNSDGSVKEKGFKGQSFMDIGQWNKHLKKEIKRFDITQNTFNGLSAEPEGAMSNFIEKKVVDEFGNDIRGYDPEWNFIEDNTIIDGEFQDERYWEHREKEVDEWLKVDYLNMPDDLCVIGFRGGEFKVFPDLFLTKEYWEEGVNRMKEVNPNMKFEVHTDDEETAKQFFPNYKVIHDIGVNWRSMRYAKYAIIANSSFFILPRWLRQGETNCYHLPSGLTVTISEPNRSGKAEAITIAPRCWARHNTRTWALPQNYYKRFTYI